MEVDAGEAERKIGQREVDQEVLEAEEVDNGKNAMETRDDLPEDKHPVDPPKEKTVIDLAEDEVNLLIIYITYGLGGAP